MSLNRLTIGPKSHLALDLIVIACQVLVMSVQNDPWAIPKLSLLSKSESTFETSFFFCKIVLLVVAEVD